MSVTLVTFFFFSPSSSLPSLFSLPFLFSLSSLSSFPSSPSLPSFSFPLLPPSLPQNSSPLSLPFLLPPLLPFLLPSLSLPSFVPSSSPSPPSQGQGGTDCDFIPAATLDKHITFESTLYPGSHVGVLPSGQLSAPAQTSKMTDASHFTVKFVVS